MVFIPPYDDPYIISGQGTVGTELLRQLSTPDLDKLHAIFVAIGGGGLVAGIAAYVKALRPGVKIYGVEPSGIDSNPSLNYVCKTFLIYLHPYDLPSIIFRHAA